MHSRSRCCQLAVWITITVLWQSAFADTIRWRASIESAIREAQRDNKLVLIHFWDYQCPPCLRLEKKVFNQEDFVQIIEEHYIPVKINISDVPRLRHQYGIERWPTDIVLNPQKQQLHRGVSKQSPDEFITLLNQLAIQATPGTPTIPGSELTTPDTYCAKQSQAITQSLTDEPRLARQFEIHEPIAAYGSRSLIRVATREQQPALPPLGLDGYCPVTLAGSVDRFPQWQQGNPQWGATHRGQLYLFVGPLEQREFLYNPERYSPVLSGRDVVRLLKHGQQLAGARQHGLTYRNRVYLFRDEHSLQEFRKAPNYYAREAVKRTAIRR